MAIWKQEISLHNKTKTRLCQLKMKGDLNKVGYLVTKESLIQFVESNSYFY